MVTEDTWCGPAGHKGRSMMSRAYGVSCDCESTTWVLLVWLWLPSIYTILPLNTWLLTHYQHIAPSVPAYAPLNASLCPAVASYVPQYQSPLSASDSSPHQPGFHLLCFGLALPLGIRLFVPPLSPPARSARPSPSIRPVPLVTR